ncbi:uncharacterized protein LOC108675631 [Hyalella azteca]|uniref:Uncharacterized protein LOC108675631 n=1 Tax=Hyalella azteca TaxID=294128 RepID=A0A8B7NZM0_HYAAZ|nr:uncharacterized protein LOC108675631 [Hyalella azteca]
MIVFNSDHGRCGFGADCIFAAFSAIRSGVCTNCVAGMSMPYAMQMVKAEQKRRSQGSSPPPPSAYMEEPPAVSIASGQSPMMYNSKMMNSIWGMYNKYSVHNFKSKLCDPSFTQAVNENGMAEALVAKSQNKKGATGFPSTAYDMFKFH